MEYVWGHRRRYNDYPSFIRKKFGGRVQKLSINAGFTCPNRDGTKDVRGCAYCNNNSFRPAYCEPDKSVTQQIEEGIAFFERKYPDMRFLAYFQSYSNTYEEVGLLDKVYSEALNHQKIRGLVIGTRPDCVNVEILDLLQEKSHDYFVTVEYGIESTLDQTLDRINRHHSFEDVKRAVALTKARDIHTGGHLILGLPGENQKDALRHAGRISELSIDTLKLHQLQIVKGTAFAKEYKRDPSEFPLFNMEEYLDLVVDFLERLSPGITVERFINQAPHDLLIAPKWGRKNFEVVAKIEKRLKERNTWQGRLSRFIPNKSFPKE